jgi:cytochrome c oxidase subunit 4
MNIPRPPLALVLSWIALCALLALTVTLAYLPLGSFNTPIALTIAAAKVLIVATIFMELRERRPIFIVFASAGLCWLTVLIWLTTTDFIWRGGFPPTPTGESKTAQTIDAR